MKIKLISRQFVIILLGLVLIFSFMILGKKQGETTSESKSFGFFKPREFAGYATNIKIGDDIENQILETPPEVDETFKLPKFPNMSEEFNNVIRTFKLGETTKQETENFFGTYLIKGENEDFYKIDGDIFQFNFGDDGRLENIFYTSPKDSGIYIKELISILNKPELIFKSSPFEPFHWEYIYASKGITFFFENQEMSVAAIAVYNPVGLEDYKKNYHKIYPFYFIK